MKDNRYVICNNDPKKIERWRDILEDFAEFSNQFGSCVKGLMTVDYNVWKTLHSIYVTGFDFDVFNIESPMKIAIGCRTEVPIEIVDSNERTVAKPTKSWFSIPRNSSQAGTKLAKLLRGYSDLIYNGDIKPEYDISPQEVDELADYVKNNLKQE